MSYLQIAVLRRRTGRQYLSMVLDTPVRVPNPTPTPKTRGPTPTRSLDLPDMTVRVATATPTPRVRDLRPVFQAPADPHCAAACRVRAPI